MKLKQPKNKQDGFTLVELLIAMAIMAILTAMTLQSFSQGNRAKAVQLGTDVVGSALRTAQSNSLNPQALRNTTCADKVPLDYRLRFNSNIPTVVTLLAQDKCSNPLITLQTFTLPRDVRIRISGLVLDSSNVGGGGGILEVKFMPPFGRLSGSLNGGAYTNFNLVQIILESNDQSVSKIVSVDGIAGRVDVQ